MDRPRSLFFLVSCGSITTFFVPIVITSLGGEGAGRCTGRLFVRPHYVAARFSTFSRGAKEGIWSLSVALPIDIFIAFFETWDGILYISIEIIMWQFSYHIPYQPLTHISLRVEGWYGYDTKTVIS